MTDSRVRSEALAQLAAPGGPPPSSTVRRWVRSATGLAGAGARSLRRSVRRRVGRDRPDLSPELTLARTAGELKGVPMKAGQILGYIDLGLPANLRAALSALHTHAPPIAIERVRAVIEAELGAAGRELARALEPEPLAVVSVGQVHRAALPGGEPVAVKVRHPGLPEAIARDFAPAALTGRVATWIFPRARLDALVGGVRARVLDECDYALEARRQRRFAELYADHPTLVVPEVLEAYSSARVLTTRLAGGVHLDDYLASGPSEAARQRAGEALFDLYVGALFRHGLYNCDPHPGNYLFQPDGRVAVVDYGAVREFDPGVAVALGALLEALRQGDRDGVHGALVSLGVVEDGRRYDAEAARWLLRALFEPLLRDEPSAFDPIAGVRLGGVLRRWWRARAFHVSAELPFLLRTFAGLASVLGRLGARARWHQRLTAPPVAEAAPPAPAVESAAPPAPAVESAAPSAPPVETSDTSRWDLVLLHPGPSQLAVLRELRDLTGLDLARLKDLMDASPQTIHQAVPRAAAETARQRLEAAGARIELRPRD